MCEGIFYTFTLYNLVVLARNLSRDLEVEVALERNHAVAIVRDGDAIQRRHGSRDLVGRKEPEDAEHGKSAIVDLRQPSSRLLLLTSVLREAERIVQVKSKVNVVAERLQRRILARHSPLHVVGNALRVGALVPNLWR